MRRKDPDKQAVYFAEALVFDDTLFKDPLHTSDFLLLADRLFKSEWWVKHSIPVPVVEPTRASDTSSYARIFGNDSKEPLLRVSPFDVNAHTLAHEAAHVAQFYFYNPRHQLGFESHGREFRATFLVVTEILLGREAADDLRASFARHIAERPEHAAGMPGSILTVPQVNADPESNAMGIYPAWRLSKQAAAFKRATATLPTGLRLYGAIAL